MRAIHVPLLAAVLLAAGCASTQRGGAAADGQVQLAIRALEAGQGDQALARLEKVRPAFSGEDGDYLTLLMAEAYLIKGEPMEALALAHEVLEERPDDPRANEVAGKSLLQMDKFADAEVRFIDAQAQVASGSPSYQRLEDLINVARGLQAYAKADPAGARLHWDSIADPQILFQVNEAIRAASVR